ncbi:MAG: hypothetical protein ABW175_16135, partial [Bradyrhizobium sp.]
MTDVTPRPLPPDWATQVGTWIGRVRAQAARVSAIFQAAPILATGVTGLLAGLWIAQWTQQQIDGHSPLAKSLAGVRMEPAATSAMSWRKDDAGAVFYDGARRPFEIEPNGQIYLLPPEMPPLRDVRPAASIVQAAREGVLAIGNDSFEIVTPGGLAAIDVSGLLYVTGEARFRNVDASNERGIDATAASGQTVWRTSKPIDWTHTNEAMPFIPALRWDTRVTAMIAVPNPSGIAVGGADGRVQFLYQGEDAEETASRRGVGSHRAPIVALAGRNRGIGIQRGALVASGASDGSIKVWYPLSRDDVNMLVSRNVLFPDGTPPHTFASDSLELSDDGQFLTVRT